MVKGAKRIPVQRNNVTGIRFADQDSARDRAGAPVLRQTHEESQLVRMRRAPGFSRRRPDTPMMEVHHAGEKDD